MKLENIYLTTDLLDDKYYNKIPPNTWVRELKDGTFQNIFNLKQRTYVKTLGAKTLIRPATPQEMEDLQKQLQALPLSSQVNIHGSYFSIGSDPEMFVVDGKGEVIPAWKFLGANPKPTLEKDDGYFFDEHIPYWDGFQAEFTTSVGNCIASWVDGIHKSMKTLQSLARGFDPTARLTGECVMGIPPEVMAQTTQEQHQLGCMPSINVYGDGGEPVSEGKTLPIRFAGCHIHLGKESLKAPSTVARIIRLADAMAGVISVSVLEGLENPLRRRFYGLAGEYRKPKYGLEYRVLSSAVMWHPALFHLFSNLVRLAAILVEANMETCWVAEEEEVRETINTLDTDRARMIIARNRAMLEDLLEKLYRDPTQANLGGKCRPHDVPSTKRIMDEFLMVGARKFITLDINQNWHLSNRKWIQHSEGPEVMMWRALKSWLDGWEHDSD